MPKLPVVSGEKVSKLLGNMGYSSIRQRGSHVRFRKITVVGEHNITVPMHDPIAKGTLNDILSRLSLWNGIPKDELIERLMKI